MDSIDSESRLSEMDESSLSNPPPSESDSSDSSESRKEAGREKRGGEGHTCSDDDDDDDDDDDEGQDQTSSEQQTEWLATTRVRRSNAGNRMKSMLANEEPDSDLELLFAEDENDLGFLDAEEHASDVQMDSSSGDDDDDDDDGDNADGTNAGDELAGEKELERQAREEKKRAAQRKRKAQAAIPAKFRKRVRIDTTASGASTPAPRPAAPAFAPRPRKKSERLSWLPSPADLPTRASSRETTRLSKEQLHQQMVEREEKRHKQMVQMQKKAARMEALKKPPMTQEDRLREAAIVEERNSKSLNRWEVAEKQREEERRAKLAALHQRTLSGPVITLWSGIGEARRAVVEEEKPKKKRERTDKAKNKATDINKSEHGKEEALGSVAGQGDVDAKRDTDSTPLKAPKIGLAPPLPVPTSSAASTTTSEVKELKLPVRQDTAEAHQHDECAQGAIDEKTRPRLMAMPRGPSPPPPPPNRTGYAHAHDHSNKPSGVLAAPVLAPPPSMNVNFDPNQTPKSNVLAPPNTSQLVSGPTVLPLMSMQSQEAISKPPPPPPPPPTTTTARFLPPPEVVEMQHVKDESTTDDIHRSEPTSQLATTESLADIATTTRNTIIFQNFDENAIKDKSIQTQVLFGQKMNRLSKPPPVSICAITNLPARYRDPKTGLAYYNAYAYREIQRLSRGEHRWSKILNAWVGSGTVAARGVPERFLNPNAPPGKRTAAPAPAPAPAGEAKAQAKSTAAQSHQDASQTEKRTAGSEQAKRSNDAPKPITKPKPAGDVMAGIKSAPTK